MPDAVPTTARSHFEDDIARAWAIHDLAAETSPADMPLATDVARTAVAFGVGALDAYMCDAFSDTLALCLKQCRRNGSAVPSGYARLALPVGPLLGDYEVRANWGLRMAARALMERDNLLQLSRLKELFNPALPPGQRLWNEMIQDYVDLDRKRLTGIRRSDYAALTGQARSRAPARASAALLRRMGDIVQRRHDIVHNCDRPKTAKQRLTLSMAKKTLTDTQDFVIVLDDHLDAHRLYAG
jgi:hypothetical protein